MKARKILGQLNKLQHINKYQTPQICFVVVVAVIVVDILLCSLF
jgi:hypothetical protein